MKNKVLIELYIVELDEYYNLYVPTNEYIGKIIKMIVNSAYELSDTTPSKEEYYIIDSTTGTVYQNDQILRDTNIKNAKKLFLI